MKLIIIFISVLLLLPSCKNNIVEPEDYIYITVNSSDELIPSKVGNYWIYEDSLQEGDSWKYGEYNTLITSQEIIDGKIFYTIKNLDIGNMSFSKYTIEDRKIYSQFSTWDPNVPYLGLKVIPATEEGVAFETTTGSDHPGDSVYAKHYKNEYRLNKYIFSEYFEYKSKTFMSAEYKVIIIPGIGVVDYYLKFIGYPPREDTLFYRSSIKSYSLN